MHGAGKGKDMTLWTQLQPCKECGKLPYLVPIKGTLKVMCDHGKQQTGVKVYDSSDDWNDAQLEKAP